MKTSKKPRRYYMICGMTTDVEREPVGAMVKAETKEEALKKGTESLKSSGVLATSIECVGGPYGLNSAGAKGMAKGVADYARRKSFS